MRLEAGESQVQLRFFFSVYTGYINRTGSIWNRDGRLRMMGKKDKVNIMDRICIFFSVSLKEQSHILVILHQVNFQEFFPLLIS